MASKVCNVVRSPVAGMGVAGIAATATAVGAFLTGNSVGAEGLTVLAGGAVVGSILGLVGWYINLVDEHRESPSVHGPAPARVAECAVVLAICLAAQPLGERFCDYGTEHGSTVLDMLCGTATIGAAVAFGYAAIYCYNGSFFNTTSQSNNEPNPHSVLTV